ncbi:hypothetical protein [Glutamicibacter ardleyensis]|uniref:hypothetical protein n=1 Tax=Glutamicibacter ardleyensis TaxID=225894 RepID=UPI003FD3ABD5
MHEGSIDWKHIAEDDFNRVVEALLMRKYHHPPKSTVEVIDGRGGDGGIDVAVYVEDKIKEIFQLKHFPEGFSGGFRDSRRKQIKKSFDTAWTNHKPPLWTLVVPSNPTVQEGKHISGLSKGKTVKATIWGIARLDSELAYHPDLLSAATRNPLLEALRTIGQEPAALVDSSDLSKRAIELHKLAAGRSLYWDVDFQVSAHGVTEIYRAKDPRAEELEPLGFNFTLKTNTFGLKQDIQRVLDFGARRHLTIPGAAVEGFNAVGPEWFQKDGAIERLEIRAADQLPADQQISVTLEFLDEDGYTRSSHQGMMHAKSVGGRGVAFLAKFYGMLELDAEIPNAISEPGRFDLSIAFAHSRVSDAQETLQLLGDFESGCVLQVLFEERKFIKGLAAGNSQQSDQSMELVDRSMELLVEDLGVLEKKLNAKFRVPSEISHRKRAMLRVARLLMEGKATWMPPGTSLTGTLSGKSADGLRMLLSGGCAITTPIPAFVLKIQGSSFNLGPAVLYHPRTVVRDAAEVTVAFETGTAAGKEVVIDPQGEQLIWVMPGNNFKEGLPETVAWDLPGISMPSVEHKDLPPGPADL